MSIKAIIFDFGEVLNATVDPEAEAERRKDLAVALGLEEGELWPYLFESEASVLWMTGQLDWDGFWEAVLEPRGITDPEAIRSFAGEVFEGEDEIHPEMIQLLNTLKGNYKLAVLSNASRTEEEMEEMFQHQLGLPSELFDTIVTSTSFGATKPDLSIYLEVLHRLEVEPGEAIFADDMDNFTAASAELGIHSHTFKSPAIFREYLKEKGVIP
ncbi:MAG TPA: HAD-IA family hydrolase [candidate division Zixibacteria bacterium]|nr:HAD-IA family hydrolase [candidate division Zixibacteria bacterium]